MGKHQHVNTGVLRHSTGQSLVGFKTYRCLDCLSRDAHSFWTSGTKSEGFTLDYALELLGGFIYVCIKISYSKGFKLGRTFESLVYVYVCT